MAALAVAPADGGEIPFTEHALPLGMTGAKHVFAADVDGDGDTDILSASVNDARIRWYENDGGSSPAFTEHVISTTAQGAWSVFAADVDGDGDTDVLSASWVDSKIAWYENDGEAPPAFTEHVISTAAVSANAVFAADVDGDGDTDVLSVSFGDNKIAWYESDGEAPPAFTEHIISTAAIGGRSVFAADLDRDKDIDVLSASEIDSKIAWYENDGETSPAFTERVISLEAAGAMSVFAADVDGDGDTDVLSASASDGKIAWYDNDGGSPPSFAERVISTIAAGAWSVFAADVDGDGDTDALSVTTGSGRLVWYENDGEIPPAFTERVVATVYGGSFSVFAADVDGDGDTDVLSTSQQPRMIGWYENCAADIDHSGVVDFNDVLSVLGAWGPYEPCPPFKDQDIDQDCEVAFGDILILLATWGPCN